MYACSNAYIKKTHLKFSIVMYFSLSCMNIFQTTCMHYFVQNAKFPQMQNSLYAWIHACMHTAPPPPPATSVYMICFISIFVVFYCFFLLVKQVCMQNSTFIHEWFRIILLSWVGFGWVAYDAILCNALYIKVRKRFLAWKHKSSCLL